MSDVGGLWIGGVVELHIIPALIAAARRDLVCKELQPHDGKGVVDDEDEEEHTQETRDKGYHGVHDVTILTLHSDQSVQRERVLMRV